MKIIINDDYGKKYEITEIEYTQYNGRDTVIEYKQDNFTKTISFEGWLDLGQIIERLREVIEE